MPYLVCRDNILFYDNFANLQSSDNITELHPSFFIVSSIFYPDNLHFGVIFNKFGWSKRKEGLKKNYRWLLAMLATEKIKSQHWLINQNPFSDFSLYKIRYLKLLI